MELASLRPGRLSAGCGIQRKQQPRLSTDNLTDGLGLVEKRRDLIGSGFECFGDESGSGTGLAGITPRVALRVKRGGDGLPAFGSTDCPEFSYNRHMIDNCWARQRQVSSHHGVN